MTTHALARPLEVFPMDSDVKPYRFVGRVKNNRLWTAIRETFPDVRTQTAAALRLGTTPSQFGILLNMTTWTSVWSRSTQRYTPLAIRISATLGMDPAYLFDPTLYGRDLPRLDVAFNPGGAPFLDGHTHRLLPEDALHLREQRDTVAAVLSTLTPREARVLTARYLDDVSLGDVAESFAITRERIRQIEAKALRKLRHPSRLRRLRAVCPWDTPDATAHNDRLTVYAYQDTPATGRLMPRHEFEALHRTDPSWRTLVQSQVAVIQHAVVLAERRALDRSVRALALSARPWLTDTTPVDWS